MAHPIYTIGHGSRTADDFLALLKLYDIQYLADVRSTPYSKYNPQFNQRELNGYLGLNGIRYVFMGDTLGGRPKDSACYDGEGKVDYDKLQTKPFFLEGIERIQTAHDKDIALAIMCSESKPAECHRSKLIGRALLQRGILLYHIDESGIIKDQVVVLNELNKGRADVDLFGNVPNSTSRNAYL